MIDFYAPRVHVEFAPNFLRPNLFFFGGRKVGDIVRVSVKALLDLEGNDPL